MASIKQATSFDKSNYTPVETSPTPQVPNDHTETEPGLNPFMRCPLPSVSATSDNLRQFYRANVFPHRRLLTSSQNAIVGGAGATSQNTTNVSGAGSAGPQGAAGKDGVGSILQASLTTGVLLPYEVAFVQIPLGKSVQIINIAATAACRIELYGTSLGQSSDAFRPIDTPVPGGVSSGIICDLVLDTLPYSLGLQNVSGANNDNPQSNLIYVTITGSVAVGAITVTFLYAQLVP